MSPKSEIIEAAVSNKLSSLRSQPGNVVALRRRNWLEVTLLFAFILLSIWTPQGPLNLLFMLAAAGAITVLALTGTWGASEMGITRPLAGAKSMLLAGAALCGLIVLIEIGGAWLSHSVAQVVAVRHLGFATAIHPAINIFSAT